MLNLHEVEHSVVGNDMRLFFKTQLSGLLKNQSDFDLTQDWPSPLEIDILCEKAAGFFFYASTVIKFVTSKNRKPTIQLDRVTSLPQSTFLEGRSGIDSLYTQALGQVVDDVDADNEELHSNFRTVVGAVLLVFNPLSARALSDLLGVSYISNILYSLHSLLLVPMCKDDPIQIFHKSLPDFLMDPRRCTDYRFFIDPPIHHTEILLSSLRFMGERLEKNICRLGDHDILSEVGDISNRRREYIGEALEYACCFWAKHLLRAPNSGPGIKKVQEAIDKFFTTCLLYWIEVLSLVGNLRIGVYALHEIQEWYTSVSYMWNVHLGTIVNTHSGRSFLQVGK